jgi:hypothetical protein
VLAAFQRLAAFKTRAVPGRSLEAGGNVSDDSATASLDPVCWEAFGALAHRTLDAALQHLQDARSVPWRPLPAAARAEIERPLPWELGEILARAERSILPYPTGNAHPRFWGWVMGNGTPDAVLADLLASAMNAHVGG